MNFSGQKISRELYDAISAVETGGCKDPENTIGDNGRAYGRYQIWDNYYRDAVEFNPSLSNGGKTWENTKGPGSTAYSEQVMQSYMNRYATEARLGHVPTDEDIARMHVGGLYGYKRDSTLSYWDKVKSNLNNKRSEPYIGCADCDQARSPSIPTPCNSTSNSTMSGSNIVKISIFLLFIVVLLTLFFTIF